MSTYPIFENFLGINKAEKTAQEKANEEPTQEPTQEQASFIPSGCLTTNDPEDTDFYSVGKNIKSIDDCFDIARNSGHMCKISGSKDAKCRFVAYREKSIDDVLSKANDLYLKSEQQKNKGNRARSIKSRNKSIELFKLAWSAMTRGEKENQIGGVSFMRGYETDSWLQNDENLSKYFMDTVNEPAKSMDLGGECWVAGSSIQNNDAYKPIEDINTFDTDTCVAERYVYSVPRRGGITADEYNDFMEKKAALDLSKAKEEADRLKGEVSGKQAFLSFISENRGKNIDLPTLLSGAQNAGKVAEVSVATESVRKDIENQINSLKTTGKQVTMLNDLDEIGREAINKNINLVRDKQGLANKMNADIQTLNWSLRESQSQENLYNKITTTLGIIIMLFVVLCVGTMVYYMIRGGKGGMKTNSGVLNDIFGMNSKTVSSANKKVLSGLF